MRWTADSTALLLVALLVVLSARWLAETVERVAVVADGPCAGEWVLAGPAGRTVLLRPVAGPVTVALALFVPATLATWAVGAGPGLPAVLVLVLAGAVLAAVDVRTHRLPDAVTLPMYPVLLALVATALDLPAAARAVEGGAVGFGVYALLALATGLGFGDVKLAGLLAGVLAWFDWSTVLRGVVAGFVWGGLAAVALLVTGRAGRGSRLAFGPFLLAGALTALVLH